MKCSKTPQFKIELGGAIHRFETMYSAKPAATYEAKEMDRMLDGFPDICAACRTTSALLLYQNLRDRYRVDFLHKDESPYLRHLGKTWGGQCAGYTTPDKKKLVRKTDR